MIIDSKSTIAGVAALKVRAFFKQIQHFELFDDWHVSKYLRLSTVDANSFLKACHRLKLIKKARFHNDRLVGWTVTTAGHSLAGASARTINRNTG